MCCVLSDHSKSTFKDIMPKMKSRDSSIGIALGT
jgi:hypothetical protein